MQYLAEIFNKVNNMASVNAEKLLAELLEKDQQLLLAARYGKNLLEENEMLRQELSVTQQDLSLAKASLEEALGQKPLNEAKKAADLLISELEHELESCHCSLEAERAAATSAREESRESRRSLNRLEEENAQLKEYLTQVKQEDAANMQDLQRRLQKSKNQKKIASGDCKRTRLSLEHMHDEKTVIGQNLSFMYRSNEKLAMKLEDTKDEVEFWEDQYHSREDLLVSQGQELEEAKDCLRQLQLELDHGCTRGPNVPHQESVSSNVSLYDELSQEENKQVEERIRIDMIPTDMVYLSDGDDPYDDDRMLTLRPRPRRGTVVPPETSSNRRVEDVRANSNDDKIPGSTCSRCVEFEADLRTSNVLLLLAAQQKFELQQQIEAWQSDMEGVLEFEMKRKLVEEERSWAKKKKKPTCKDHITHFVTDSCLFG